MPISIPITKQDLSKYQCFILDKIINDLEAGKDIKLFSLVESAVSQKCILPSRNTLVMETYNAIEEYLLAMKCVTEKEEMTAYVLTEKGKNMVAGGTIEAFEKSEAKKQKRSFLDKLLNYSGKDSFFFNVERQTLIDYE